MAKTQITVKAPKLKKVLALFDLERKEQHLIYMFITREFLSQLQEFQSGRPDQEKDLKDALEVTLPYIKALIISLITDLGEDYSYKLLEIEEKEEK